ncbi:alpha-ketoglutarate-dependent dioxygenase AlkB [Chitinophaga pendula]|nr:alpha-ketoglutarate-dependent dioxygenase AlkB [Chitinophaga pendula]
MNRQLPFFHEPEHQLITLQDGLLHYYPSFFPPQEADNWMQQLLNEVSWQQEHIIIYGKQVPFPRLMAWYGDAGSNYAFSGNTYSPKPWIPVLSTIQSRIEAVSHTTFNSVLLNYYRNGQDSMGWHADDEPELGRNPIIASVNLGATRRFQLRHKQDHQRTATVDLQHGSLLIMTGPLQHHWQHQVPKTKRPVPARINLTFRHIFPPAQIE